MLKPGVWKRSRSYFRFHQQRDTDFIRLHLFFISVPDFLCLILSEVLHSVGEPWYFKSVSVIGSLAISLAYPWIQPFFGPVLFHLY